MAKTKQQALTRIDNNYEINLRYPDINDFLKDTFFSLQDNQTLEQSLVANVRVSTPKIKEPCTVTIAAHTLFLDLTPVTIFGFSENQELLYDFEITPILFGVQLSKFTADRTNSEALVQSVESYSTTNSNEVANFNIRLSSGKIASILTDAFNTRENIDKIKEFIKRATESESILKDPEFITYIRESLFSQAIEFNLMYRFQDDAAYERGFLLSFPLSYLQTVPGTVSLLQSSSIAPVIYSPTLSSAQIEFTAKFTLAGKVRVNQRVNNVVKYIDNADIDVQANVATPFNSNFRVGEYLWETVSGIDVTAPNYIYSYLFTPSNNVNATFSGAVGSFSNFEHKPTTANSIKINVTNYTIQVSKVNSSYNPAITFTLTDTTNKLKNLFDSNNRPSPTLGCTVEFLETIKDASLVTAANSRERCFLYGTLNNTQEKSIVSFKSITYSGVASVFSTAATTRERTGFTKITQRVVSTYSGIPNFTSSKLGQFTMGVAFATKTAQITVTWPPLSVAELQALHQLTTAPQLRVSLVDAFFNQLATGTGVTGNTLTRSESPMINPSNWYYYTRLAASKLTINAADTTKISDLFSKKNIGVNLPATITYYNNPLILSSTISYKNTAFDLLSAIKCVGVRKVGNAFNWADTVYTPTSNEVIVSDAKISVNKAALAAKLWGTPAPTKDYFIYVLLPFKFVRNVVVNSQNVPIVFTELVDGKYYYGYAIKV